MTETMRTWTWEEIKGLLNEGICHHSLEFIRSEARIREALRSTPGEYRAALAAAFALAKWTPHNGEEFRLYRPCGLCTYHWLGESPRTWGCSSCPLEHKTRSACSEAGSLFKRALTGDTKARWEMYQLLLELYTEEYNKL